MHCRNTYGYRTVVSLFIGTWLLRINLLDGRLSSDARGTDAEDNNDDLRSQCQDTD